MAQQYTKILNLEVENKKLKKKQERIKRQKAKWNERDFLYKTNDQLLEENKILKRRVEILESLAEFFRTELQSYCEKTLDDFIASGKEDR